MILAIGVGRRKRRWVVELDQFFSILGRFPRFCEKVTTERINIWGVRGKGVSEGQKKKNLDFFSSTHVDVKSSALNFKKNYFLLRGRERVEKSILPNLNFFFTRFLQCFWLELKKHATKIGHYLETVFSPKKSNIFESSRSRQKKNIFSKLGFWEVYMKRCLWVTPAHDLLKLTTVGG